MANAMDPELLIVGDQVYQLIGRSVRTSGSTELRWSSNCPVCGARFTVKTSEASRHESLRRRCRSCRRPGRFARKWTPRNDRAPADEPDMTPEEHKRRGDAADALFREMKRRATGKDRLERR
jgi:hypothetical protein